MQTAARQTGPQQRQINPTKAKTLLVKLRILPKSLFLFKDTTPLFFIFNVR